MSYIDAGYAVALTVLFSYAGLLVFRHRRLSRLAASVQRSEDEA
ncbi:MAG: hypothetical protein ACRDV4_03980 [Acidimicrobiales bacterium]